MAKDLTSKSKQLAFLLRHDTEYSFVQGGWRIVMDLINHHGFTMEELEEIVRTDEKGRYEFNGDKNLIRARQGHSINVDVELEETTPPDILYHGTATRFVNSILREGLLPMSRQYVHLSSDIETAKKVGIRHGEPHILSINAKQMADDGFKFFKSRNGVWLIKRVPVKYITFNVKS